MSRKKHPGSALLWAILFFWTGTPFLLAQVGEQTNQIDLDGARAEEEFRFGVQAYHATRYNDAIVAFTRALSFTPDDALMRLWLGRAYLQAGLEDAALGEWDIVVDQGAAAAYLLSRIDTLRYRRGIMPFQRLPLRLARSQLIDAQPQGNRLFHRPAGIAAQPDGGVIFSSLASQEVVRLTPNGQVTQRMQGGIEGFDQPFDVAVAPDGTVFVSEFGGDRVAVMAANGSKARVIGERGLAPGQLLGPQYLAISDALDLYVSEWGNRRVSKFALDGSFVQTIGEPSAFFGGLQRPTGVTTDSEGRLFVADADAQGVALHVFDSSGNHLRRIDLPLSNDDAAVDSLSGAVVEDIGWYDDDSLLLTTGRDVMVFNPTTEAVLTRVTDEQRRRVHGAARDINGRVFVTDFDASEIGVFEPEGTLYAGLDVRIDRIIARDFPSVAMLVRVADRDGRPLLGLDSQNFVVSERGTIVSNAQLESSGLFTERLESAMLVLPTVSDRRTNPYRDQARRIVQDLVSALEPTDGIRLYAAVSGARELLVGPGEPIRYGDVAASAIVPERPADFDLGAAIRQAARPLVSGGIQRHMVLVTDGELPEGSFGAYGLEETRRFLSANGIRLYVIVAQQGSVAGELEYLAGQSGGEVRFAFEPEGLRSMVQDMRGRPLGAYWLTFSAGSDPDFGRRYIDMAVEVNFFVRSGRDQLGFFGLPSQ